MLFSSLYCSLFGLVERELGEEEGQTAVAAIRDGLNAVLSHSTDYHAPFIGSLHVSRVDSQSLSLSKEYFTGFIN